MLDGLLVLQASLELFDHEDGASVAIEQRPLRMTFTGNDEHSPLSLTKGSHARTSCKRHCKRHC